MMDMEKMLSQSVDQMLQMQVQQNPALAPFQAEMKAFLGKYMSWASMKDDMVKLYAAEFTEPELKELVTFYQTPVGKKSIQKMPVLMSKGAEIGQKRVQEHLPELQSAIQAKGGGWPNDGELADAFRGLTFDSPTSTITLREDGQGLEDQIVGLSSHGDRFPFAVPRDMVIFPAAMVSTPVGQKSVDWLKSLKPDILEKVPAPIAS